MDRNEYRRLKTVDGKTWLAYDHVLQIKNGVLRETYSRLYWADVRAALLYSLERAGAPLLIAEGLSVAFAIAGAIFVRPLWGSVLGLLFAAIYGAWRFTRPRWAAQLSTRITSIKIPLTYSPDSSRRLLNEVVAQITSAQQTFPISESPTPPPGPLTLAWTADLKSDKPQSHRVSLILYGCLFAFGAMSGFNQSTAALYCTLFLLTFFATRDFEYPLSVRSAIVLNQMVAVLRIAVWIASFRLPFLVLVGSRLTHANEFTMASTAFSLYGLLAVVIVFRRTRQYRVRSSTFLGLGSPAT